MRAKEPGDPAPRSIAIGQRFVEHYRTHGYEAIPGSSLLDPSVPMSFVMSAGLVQVETSALHRGGRTGDRYVLIQNCFRHFDLDQVVRSDTHLSLFQMPGAFSFNPPGKHDNLSQVWTLLTEVYGLRADALWATYFGGGLVAGHTFRPDGETYHAWREVGVPPERIVGLGAEHNFWKQGAGVVGKAHVPKCGPHAEIFFDRGANLGCGSGCRPGCHCGRFVELVNTLFITWHIDDETGSVRPLEEPFTETVMGAERMAMLLQEVSSVFEIDSIQPLIAAVRRFARAHALSLATRVRHERILADHIRALLFLAADDAPPPGKGGRAYLMRRLIRGALTSQQILSISDPAFLRTLIDGTVALYLEQYPQLSSGRDVLWDYVAEERDRFKRTVKAGRQRLERLLKKRGHRSISGEEMLNLEKRHGLPLPLLEVMLTKQKVQYSRQAYDAAYARWRRALVGAD